MNSKAISNNNSISDKHRPFFSIICPCYNTKADHIETLLNSLLAQSIDKEDMEIILSDDCSTDTSYYEAVEPFKENLNIIQVQTNKDSLHCPGNNRENGVQYATGKWITFTDHDDFYLNGVFSLVRNSIEEANEQYLVCSNILQVDPLDNNRIIQEIRYATNWMHGKFYNLDNLWKAYDFHFKKDLVSNEDIYISNKLHCILHNIHKNQVLWLPDYTYIWRAFPDSTSHKKYSDDLTYMEYFFYDYINATYDIHNEEYDKLLAEKGELSEDDKKFYMEMQADALFFQYFYLQSFKYKKDYLQEHEDIVKRNLKDYYKKFDIDPDHLYSLACSELDNDDIREGGFITKIWYNSVRYSVTVSCGNFIETDNFRSFISNV